ncbi:MAG: uroporphyrinogen decarboxylase family protein [Anaerolineae bacterium]|nr:uroporphyrinogen decarboxylase family protein [Anaerolineae bacterium]
MNNLERVLACLRHQQPDRVPYQIEFTQRMHQAMVQYYEDPCFAQKLGNCLSFLGCEPKDAWREVAPDIWQDEFGVQWNRSIDKDIGVVCNRLVTPANVRTFPMPDADDPSRFEGFGERIASRTDAFWVASVSFTLFERAWTLAGMEEVLAAMVVDKPFINQLLDRILEFNLRLIENACRYPIHAMMFGDDWGQQRGLLMGPRLWREFIKPRITQMYQAVKAHGKFVFIHSCGKVDEVFPDLIECGVDVFNPFQPEVIDVYETKRRHGASLTFYGGISTQNTLPFGTPQQVRDEVRRLLDEVGRDGGYIAAPSHAIPAGARPENVAAMIEVLQTQ